MMLLIRRHLGNWSAGMAIRKSRRLKEMLSKCLFWKSELFLWFLYMWSHMCWGGRHRGGCRRTLNVVPQSLSFSVFETRYLTDVKLAKWVGLAGVSHRDLLASTSPAGILGAPPCLLCKCEFSEASVQGKHFTNWNSSYLLKYITLYFIFFSWIYGEK